MELGSASIRGNLHHSSPVRVDINYVKCHSQNTITYNTDMLVYLAMDCVIFIVFIFNRACVRACVCVRIRVHVRVWCVTNTYQYLAIDSGGYLCTNSHHILIAIRLDAFQRS